MHKPIFIHSLFRSNSTYFLNKFDLNGYCCFCEPFHENLCNIKSIKNIEYGVVKKLKHSDFLKNSELYTKNYIKDMKKNSIVGFQKLFSYEKFDISKEEIYDDLKVYIDGLLNISEKQNKISVFKFCRSLLRIEWLNQNYNPLNIFLIRDPRDQWFSINDVSLSYFMNCYIRSIKQSNSNKFDLLQKKYGKNLRINNNRDYYFILYYFHKLFEKTISKIGSDKITIETNLFTNYDYKNEIIKNLSSYGININFDNFKYNKYNKTESFFEDVEKEVDDMILNL